MGGLWTCSGDCIDSFRIPKQQKKLELSSEELASAGGLSVRIGTEKAKGQRVAVKCFSKRKCTAEEVKRGRGEIEVLKRLNHPCVVRYICHTEDVEFLYLAMELCDGGNLDMLIRSRRATEARVKPIFKAVLEALEYLHSQHVCHRDVKPENILFTSDERTKLADFGLARHFTNEPMRSRLGTPYYLAPEILKGQYSEKCDLWSAGIVLYYSLRGRRPFTSSIYRDLTNEIVAGQITDWGEMSKKAVDLVRRLLERDPTKRLSAREALEHPWLQDDKD